MGELLQIENLSKGFPGVLANDRISLSVEEGEILALLGENGAGKTTLMNCLYGLLQPDAGQIYWRGNPVKIPDSRSAVDLGIGMVHQHFMLIPVLSVLENVALGMPSSRGLLLDLDRIETRLVALSKEYGMDLDPRALVWQLPVGVQQRVEIMKALYRDIKLLILDEPTAVLTPHEVSDLFSVLKRLTARGLAVILITHKLEEVMAVSDRATVLRDGRVVGTVKTSETDAHQLAKMMVGREVVLELNKPAASPGAPALELKNLKAQGDRGRPALRDVSLTVHQGEILGIAGVDGNGQLELEEVLSGLRPLSGGTILLAGEDISSYSPAHRHKMGLAHIPSDRLDRGVATTLTVEENLVANVIAWPPYSKRGVLNFTQIHNFSRQAVAEFHIRSSSPRSTLVTLSGGNQQRVVLAAALSHNPKIIVAAQPKRGLDVGVTQQVYDRLLKERSKGTAILLISTELQEILALSDRIAVMYRGEIMGIVKASADALHDVGMMMAGLRIEAKEGGSA
jgi:general nucleoside transport system ATP-binding protein